jgi:hypothetical protein
MGVCFGPVQMILSARSNDIALAVSRGTLFLDGKGRGSR